MGVTLLDVARAAGVSRTTASNAFSNPAQLSRSLRESVLKTAKDLGYGGPSPVARAMRRGRTMMVGVVFQESLRFALEDPYARALLAGLSERLTEAEYNLALVPVDEKGASLEHLQVDGIVCYRLSVGHPAFEVARRRAWKVVRTGSPALEGAPSHSVTIDEAGGARLAMQHLADIGFGRVFVLVDMDQADMFAQDSTPTFLFNEQAERWKGFQNVASNHNIELIPVGVGRNVRANGFKAVRGLLAEGPIGAIAAMTDVLALGAMDAIRAAGLEIGRDISVVGFDDISEAAEAGLTTVAQPIWERGFEAARLLVEDSPPVHIALPCTLIIRSSTGPSHVP